MFKRELILATYVLVLGAVCASPSPHGEHVCNKTITVARERTVDEPIRYEIKYRTMCGILPCTKTRTEDRIDSRIVTYYEEVQVSQCCPGYAEAPDKKCAPVCLNSCANGRCVSPGVCKCSPEPTETTPGYIGSTCSRYTCLAVDRWGAKCDRECNCPPNAYCSATTGKCLCRSGWRGANCSEECTNDMSCEEGELPPIIEPEVNVISDDISAPEKLELRNLENFDQSPSSKTVTSLIAAHMGLNLFLTILTFTLIFIIVVYRRRLNEIRNELYYGSYSSGSSSNGGGSEYSAAPNTILNRPRMPTPNESNFLGKNLSFATATRAILNKDNQSSKPPGTRVRFVADPKVEAHLMSSQASSKQNVYSDLEANKTSKPAIESVLLVENPASSVENDYQVPRVASTNVLPSIPRFETQETAHYENEYSIYEEIKPRSDNHDQKN